MEQVNNQLIDRIVTVAVDVQNDFCPGGSLAVTEGDQVVPPINNVIEFTRQQNGLVVATRDWHPRETAHFAEAGGPWPVHCVANTYGAAFKEGLAVDLNTDTIINKGTDPVDDGYSGFDGAAEGGLTLEALIRPTRSERVGVIIGGLATDYCVKATVLDALALRNKLAGEQKGELTVIALTDAMRAVNVNPGDGDKALAEMEAAGAAMLTSDEVVNGALQAA